jgi:hypothetical protein
MRRFWLLIILFSLLGCGSQQVKPADKNFVVRATDLVDFGYGYKSITKHEKFQKTGYYDRSYDVEYEFATPDKEQVDPLYMQVILGANASGQDAIVGESTTRWVEGFQLKQENIKQTPIKGAKTYGHSSSLYLLSYENVPIGNLFRCRQGKRTYSIIMSGFYLDNAADWDELVRDKVQKWLNTP